MSGRAVRERVTDWDEPFSEAVTVAVWSASSAPVLAVKVAEAALAATVTEGGTVNTDGALLESATTVLLEELGQGDGAGGARVGGQTGGRTLQGGESEWEQLPGRW